MKAIVELSVVDEAAAAAVEAAAEPEPERAGFLEQFMLVCTQMQGALMIIIGEKINGAIPSTARAIVARDADYIRNLAVVQNECGADCLDVCAGTETSEEYDALCWFIDVVQDATDKPLCLDSPDPRMLVRVFERVERSGLINSVSAVCELRQLREPATLSYVERLVLGPWDDLFVRVSPNSTVPGEAFASPGSVW